MNLKTLFNPRTIAVIGAAEDRKKLGYALYANLVAGKKRRVYPVNPAFKKVLGKHCYSSVKKIGGKIDLAVIAVKPEIVPIVVKECGEKKIPHAIVITAGFKEVGPEGEKKEKDIVAIARKYKINLVGPNCLGIMDTGSVLNATFGNDLPKKGGVAFVSQSGALGTAMLDWAGVRGIGFSKFISLGNAAGLQENDFLSYLGADKQTSAIIMYLEGLSDGERFVNLCRRISRRKPIVVLKAGRSERGAKAVSSHTGSLAPSFEIFRAACREGKAALIDSLGQMFDAVRLFNSGIRNVPNKWVILTNGGGPSIVTADLIENSPNLALAALGEPIQMALRKVLPPTASVGNPVDIVGDALEDRYRAALKVLTSQKENFGIIVLLTPQRVTPVEKIAEEMVRFKGKKLLVPLFIGGGAIAPAEKLFSRHGLVNFVDPAGMINTLSVLAPETQKQPEIKAAAAGSAVQTKERMMWFNEAKVLMAKYGLKIVGNFVGSKDKLEHFGGKISFPWAMKLVSPEAVHKTEVGGVKINIADIESAKTAWDEMSKNLLAKNPSAKIDGFVVQPMVRGKEVIIGIKRDPSFGPVVVFGLGGIFTEIIKDVSMRLCPVGEKEALKMIKEIKSASVLTGARGGKPVNLAALAKIITSLSRLAEREKAITEIDLNPVMVSEESADIVDIRVMVKKNA